jgi:hypothetical protein
MINKRGVGKTVEKMLKQRLEYLFKLIKFTIITPTGDDTAIKDYVYAERLEVTSNSGYRFYVGDMMIKSIKYDPAIKFSTELGG